MDITRNPVSGFPLSQSIGSLTTTTSFDSHGNLAHSDSATGPVSLFDVQYARDAAGRIIAKTEATPTGTTVWGYVYDTAGRLVQVDRNGASYATYTYDANGNRIARTDGDGTEWAVTDAQDRLVSYDGESFEYNATGEMTSRTVAATSGTTNYTYSASGRLKTVQLQDGTDIEYIHDALGRRVAKQVDGVTEDRFLYGPGVIEPVAQVDADGNVIERYVYGSSTVVPDYIEKGGNKYRVITDQLGSVRLVVDASDGTVAQALDYDEYGRVTRDTSPGFQPFGFAGGILDSDTGLVHLGAREYDPKLGRFTTIDPLGFDGGSFNLHGYALGDPVNFIDPTGMAYQPDLPELLTDPVNAIGGVAGDLFNGSVDFAADPFGAVSAAEREIAEAADELGITDLAEQAQQFWVDVTNDPCAPAWLKSVAWVAGPASSLATRENIGQTVLVLSPVAGARVLRTFAKWMRTRRISQEGGASAGGAGSGSGAGSGVARRSAQEMLYPDGQLIGVPGDGENIRVVTGSADDAERFFEELASEGTHHQTIPYGKVVKMPEGRGFVTFRSESKSGPPTIDINMPEFPGIEKIKFKEG